MAVKIGFFAANAAKSLAAISLIHPVAIYFRITAVMTIKISLALEDAAGLTLRPVILGRFQVLLNDGAASGIQKHFRRSIMLLRFADDSPIKRADYCEFLVMAFFRGEKNRV